MMDAAYTNGIASLTSNYYNSDDVDSVASSSSQSAIRLQVTCGCQSCDKRL